jgi:hypothetical protein
MPRASGIYTAPGSSWNPPTNGNQATAGDWAALLADIAAALTQSVSADGQTGVTGNIGMGGNKLTGLGEGTLAGDSLRWQQLFSQGVPVQVASAAAVDVGGQNSVAVEITGTTGITSFGSNYNSPRFIRFTGALTLTNSVTLALPGGLDITTAAGDVCVALPNQALTGWNVYAYVRASGMVTIPPAPTLGTDGTNKTYVDGSISTSAAALTAAIAASVAQATTVVSVNTTTGFTAAVGFHYICTNVAAVTVTLPSGTPVTGSYIGMTFTNGLATNVIARNGNTIMALAEDMTVDSTTGLTVWLRFANNDWRLV